MLNFSESQRWMLQLFLMPFSFSYFFSTIFYIHVKAVKVLLFIPFILTRTLIPFCNIKKLIWMLSSYGVKWTINIMAMISSPKVDAITRFLLEFIMREKIFFFFRWNITFIKKCHETIISLSYSIGYWIANIW